jgi:hypothetical protein
MPRLGPLRKSTVLLALALGAALVALLVPVAGASRVPISGRYGGAVFMYAGTDRYGAVTLGYYAPGRKTTAGITKFQFANRCNRKGSRVTVTFPVSTKTKTFDYVAAKFRVSGTLSGKLSLPTKFTGSAQVETPRCSSGAVAFTARRPKVPYHYP